MSVFEQVQDLRPFRSCRDEVIPRKTMGKILEAGRKAPSPGNVQSLEFIVVEDDGKKEMLYNASDDKRVLEAPDIVIVISDRERIRRRIGNGADGVCNAESACAVQNMRLVARSEGVGSCWISGFDRQEVREKLKIPNGKAPLAMVLFGYTDDEGEQESRFGMNEVCFYDEYDAQIASFWDSPAWRGLRTESTIQEKKFRSLADKLRRKLRQLL